MPIRIATRRNKYNATKVKVDGQTFDSKAEYRRWCELRLLERAGEITQLARQPQYVFTHGGTLIGSYRGDFFYVETNGSQRVVEDVKSPATVTGEYRIKRNLMKAFFPWIEFREVMT